MEVRWAKRAGQERRSRERTYQGSLPFKTYSCLCLGTTWVQACVPVGKSYTLLGLGFPDGERRPPGPSENNRSVSSEKQPTPCGMSFTPASVPPEPRAEAFPLPPSS